ncbi:hypothetical protein VTN49DRAFT_3292 [Thermomyces lanuginosus]|uniref:uncharacterized protein n=1 Tax=Thermomyces lanuginosus TaxID=5541 RepID=UPI00374446CB
MTHSTEETTSRIRSRQSYRETLDRIARLYKREISSRPESSTPRKTHRRHSSMPAQLSPHPSPRPRTSTLPNQDDFQATATFLRRLGLSLPAEPAMAYQVASEKKREQDQLLRHLATAAQITALSGPLQTTDQATELLWTALYSSSDFKPSLTDETRKERLTELEKRLAALQRGIEGVDLEAASRRDRVKEKFLERWAHQ